MRTFTVPILFLVGANAFGQTLRPYEPGEWRLKLGLPYVNSFYLQPENETPKSRTGFLGFEGGLEYQRGERSFLALELSMSLASPFPIGPYDIEGEFDRYGSSALTITDNHLAGRFSFGYGLSVARNTWSYTRTFIADSIPPSRPLVDRSSTNLGLVFNGYYRIGRAFHAGLIYRSYFFKFEMPDPWQYEHVISIDLMWRIHFGRKAPLK